MAVKRFEQDRGVVLFGHLCQLLSRIDHAFPDLFLEMMLDSRRRLLGIVVESRFGDEGADFHMRADPHHRLEVSQVGSSLGWVRMD